MYTLFLVDDLHFFQILINLYVKWCKAVQTAIKLGGQDQQINSTEG
jgi:hypothetical protein